MNGWREEGDFSIFITDSNSYLLSGELATKLTGRYVEINVFPFSFDEYLKMKGHLGISQSGDIQAELRSCILEGGFPYALRLPSINDKREYVRNLISGIYEKDIRRRVRIRNRSVFESVVKYVISNFGSTTSLQNIADDFSKIKEKPLW